MQNLKSITVVAANCRGNPANCLYPNRIEITDAASAAEAFSRDIVCAEYINSYRNVENFLISNALPMDCDNDHSDDPKMWFAAENIHEFFRDVPHIIHYSQHHMKPKSDYSARPRFHMVFLIDPESDPDTYAKLKQRLRALFPFFDPMALDAARFLLGTEDPQDAGGQGVQRKTDASELADKAKEISAFQEILPLKLFVDDVTAEKLASVLAENNSKAAIVSAEGGIFDILNGIYTKNVNIDVFLKGHSGDTIRVDRIGRASESILHPTLTMLLAVQPEVLNGLMTNGTFRDRGLTARFLYAMPKSSLGIRSFHTKPISETVKTEYTKLIRSMLEVDAQEEPIELSEEATVVLEQLFQDAESRFHTNLAEIADWAGKYVGAVLRIAGLLHGA